MERSVNIMRCRRTGAFLLNPVGTFRGYGAYVGINPYREVPSDAADSALGRMVMQLLILSGPTGIPIQEAKPYLEASRDSETNRVRRKFGLDRPGKTTSKLARRFVHATVYQKHGQKSSVVQVFSYDSRWRAMSGEEPSMRVKHTAGAKALGAAVRAALQLPEKKTRTTRTKK